MKHNVYLLILVFLTMVVSCNTQSKDKKDTTSTVIKIKVKESFLLLPIQDKADEVVATVYYPDSTHSSKYWIRLAEDKIDYWVKLDVKDYIGKEIELKLENFQKANFGISKIKQADKFNIKYNEQYRPSFHFTPEYGWMNDPNGMVYFDGEYHLFFQYNPYGNTWGNMHWGHAVSTDLLSWTYLPVAIAPDSLGAIFSGSAVVDVNNTAGFGKDAIVAIYTSAGEVQAQSIAYSTDKGRTFTKYSGNPVIPNTGIPDFRDPKVFWHNETNQWIMSLATKQTITFYGSSNLKEWKRLSEFGEGIGSHDGVWECPDMFPLQYAGKTKWVLLVSINPGGPNGGSATQYFIGDFDGVKFSPDELPYPLWLDYGRDNYAGVTWSNIPEDDGRRIFIGWMSNWDYANQVPTKHFRSANTVPRELKLVSNGKHLVLANYPVAETEKLRNTANIKSFDEILIKDEYTINKLLDGNKGSFEIVFSMMPDNVNNFGFALENSKGESLNVVFDKKASQISVDRQNSGLTSFKDNFASEMKAPLSERKEYKIQILADRASVELFVNDGETVFSSIIFPTEWLNNIRFYSKEGEMKISNLKIYSLNY